MGNVKCRTLYKQWEHNFDQAIKDIKFPVKLTDVQTIANRFGIPINFYGYENKSVFDIRHYEREETYTYQPSPIQGTLLLN
jgi:hypothetical protein